MAVETGTTLADLEDLWPLSGDDIIEGDNHIRLIKAILKSQFPGVGGDGLASAILATETELNYLQGLTSNIQSQLDAIVADDALVAPAGTVMVFYQAAPPTGWTQVVTHNDKMLRIVSGAGGGSGGSDSPISFSVPNHTHTTAAHTLTEAEMPSHSHVLVNTDQLSGTDLNLTNANYIAQKNTYGSNDPTYQLRGSNTLPSVGVSGDSGGDGSHTHGDTGSAGAATFTPLYIDMIIASKD